MRWEQFQKFFLATHKQGEHISIVGPTGSGKSVVGIELCKLIATRSTPVAKGSALRRPTHVTVLGTKPKDETLSALHQQGWPIIKTWPPAYGEEHCIVWPRSRKANPQQMQAKVFEVLLDEIYVEGGQTVFIDEAAYFERPLPKGLGLSSTMENFWSNMRSNKVTVIAATQRPRHVSLLMWSENSWFFIFPPKDERDLVTVAQASGRRYDVVNVVENLGGYEFLCVVAKRDGLNDLIVSKVQE